MKLNMRTYPNNSFQSGGRQKRRKEKQKGQQARNMYTGPQRQMQKEYMPNLARERQAVSSLRERERTPDEK